MKKLDAPSFEDMDTRLGQEMAKCARDYDEARRALTRASHSLTAAIVRDGAVTSGSYSVPDTGYASRVEADPTKAYLTLRVTLPICYEAQL